MAKTIVKETIKDFKLIGERTKQRIIGLIEKRLTAQTIMLFAQEYESYDIEIRDEIVEFIMFLLNREEETLRLNESKIADSRSKIMMDRKKMEFQEKQSNFKKIQEALSRSEVNKKQRFEPKVELKVTKPTPIAEVKTQTKPKLDSKLEKMLKEAELREQKLAREEKQRQEELAIKAKLEEEQKKKEVKPKTASKPKVASTSNKVKRPSTKKPLSYDEKLLAKQVNGKSTQERDYEKEQKEKERLWQELYGKTREQSLEQKQKIIEKEARRNDINKTPTIEEIKLTDFKLNGVLCPIDELTDPKNKLYVFWSDIKVKYHAANISAWLKDKPMKFQRKIYKKRVKTLKYFNKLTGNKGPKSNNQNVEKTNQKED